MKKRTIVFLIALVLSCFYVAWLGRSVLVTLGWASFLIPTVCGIMAFAIRVRLRYSTILLFTLTLTGFVIVNHLTSLAVSRGFPLNIFTMYLYLLPMILIYLPFVALMEDPFRKTAQLPGKKVEVFTNYRHLVSFLVVGAVFAGLCLTFVSRKLSSAPFILFGPFIFCSAVLLYILKKVPRAEMEYLLEALPTVRVLRDKNIKLVGIGFVGVTLAATLLEYARGLWFYGFLYALSLCLIGLNLLRVYRYTFDAKGDSIVDPEKYSIPQIPVVTLAVVLAVAVCLYCVIIAMTGLTTIEQFFLMR